MTTIENSNILPEISGLYFREKRDPAAADAPDTDSANKTGTDTEKSLLCRQCRAVVTGNRYAVAVNGNHLHTFFNPAGIIYEIRCFKQAAGCAVYGQPTEEFSWFRGYVWQYSFCAACLIHLGWLFYSGENSFFGLISNKLVEG